MAERLPSFDWTEGGRASHPWEEWEDGSPWLILQGEDFEVTLKSMQSQIYLRARAIGRTVQTRFQQDPPGVIFQFGGLRGEPKRRQSAAFEETEPDAFPGDN